MFATLEERKARIRASRPTRKRKQLHRYAHPQSRIPRVLLLGIGVAVLILSAVLLTGCQETYTQVWADYTFVYPKDGQAVAVVNGSEYYAPMPLLDGCYHLFEPVLGSVGKMEFVGPFCGR